MENYGHNFAIVYEHTLDNLRKGLLLCGRRIRLFPLAYGVGFVEKAISTGNVNALNNRPIFVHTLECSRMFDPL